MKKFLLITGLLSVGIVLLYELYYYMTVLRQDDVDRIGADITDQLDLNKIGK